MCMIDDTERVTALGEGRSTSRIAARCDECKRVIEKGERYLWHRFVFDGRAKTHRFCSHCEVALNWLASECGGWAYGQIEEDIREHVFSGIHSMALARLAVGMQWQWKTPKHDQLLPIPKMPTTTHQKTQEPPR